MSSSFAYDLFCCLLLRSDRVAIKREQKPRIAITNQGLRSKKSKSTSKNQKKDKKKDKKLLLISF
jgi:hypothetical protein